MPGWSPSGVRIGLSRSASSREDASEDPADGVGKAVGGLRVDLPRDAFDRPCDRGLDRLHCVEEDREGVTVTQDGAPPGRLLQRLEDNLSRDVV